MSAPLTALVSAETALVSAINAATQRIDAVAGDDLSSALRRLHAATLAARSRLEAARDAYTAFVESVGAVADDLACEVRADVEASTPEPTPEEPTPTPLPEPESEPAPPMPRAEEARVEVSEAAMGAMLDAFLDTTLNEKENLRGEVATALTPPKNGRKRKGVAK